MVEGQDEFPDLGLLSADPVQPLLLHADGLDELQALVDDDGDVGARQLLLSQGNPRDLGVPQSRHPGLRFREGLRLQEIGPAGRGRGITQLIGLTGIGRTDMYVDSMYITVR